MNCGQLVIRSWRTLLLACAFGSSLLGAANASAAGGNYLFAGGTGAEQAQVRSALNASAFDWSLVPTRVTIHIQRGIMTSHATPGEIWLDADLLDAGQFSWGTVQMEYAHQVHFLLLDDQQRSTLTTALGAQAWCWEKPGVAHGDNGCERFSATLAWAFWPSAANALRPASESDESASMAPAAFRALVTTMLGTPDPLARTLARRLPTRRGAR
jgi:hypothetical protein